MKKAFVSHILYRNTAFGKKINILLKWKDQGASYYIIYKLFCVASFILAFNEFLHFSTHPQPTKYRCLLPVYWVDQKVCSVLSIRRPPPYGKTQTSFWANPILYHRVSEGQESWSGLTGSALTGTRSLMKTWSSCWLGLQSLETWLRQEGLPPSSFLWLMEALSSSLRASPQGHLTW